MVTTWYNSSSLSPIHNSPAYFAAATHHCRHSEVALRDNQNLKLTRGVALLYILSNSCEKETHLACDLDSLVSVPCPPTRCSFSFIAYKKKKNQVLTGKQTEKPST